MKPRSASSFSFVAPNAPQRHKIGLYIYAQRVLSRAQFSISSRPKENNWLDRRDSIGFSKGFSRAKKTSLF
jgi:hypothetical protein